MCVWLYAFSQGSQERVLARVEKIFAPLPKKGGLAKNLCAKSKKTDSQLQGRFGLGLKG